MRNGWHVCAADAHVNSAAAILERDIDPSFRPRLAEPTP
jgi:hypothetical protein